jgi:hypothetical protein
MWKKGLFLGLCLPFTAVAGELTGYASIEQRAFLQAPQYDGSNLGNTPSFVLEPEWFHVSEDQAHTITFRPFARYDDNDQNRSHIDVRQMDWLYSADHWEWKMGASKVFWGVTESNHLVDIINQTDAIEGVDGEDKLGQPMMQLGLFRPWGNVRFFYLPYFRERTLSGYTSRLRSAVPSEDHASYASEYEEWNPDVAVRYTHTLGDWDIGLAHFSGTNREPIMQADTNTQGADILVPYYDTIDQTSLDVQYTYDAWLWKLETISRQASVDRFFAFSGGVEYTFYTVLDTDKDIGVVVEYSRDDRDTGEAATLLDDDLFVAARFTFNDVEGTELLGGVMIDRNSQAQAYSLEASRRINNHWKVEVESRFFHNIDADNVESGFRKDDFVQLNFSYYF